MPSDTPFEESDSSVDMLGAVAAGFCVGMLSYVMSTASGKDSNFYYPARLFLCALLVYPAVAWLLKRCWTGALRRILPPWIVIAILGSLIFVSIGTGLSLVNAWRYPGTVWPNWNEFVRRRIQDTTAGVVLFSMLTLIVTAIFHYSDNIFRLLKRWHSGPEKPPGILGKRRT